MSATTLTLVDNRATIVVAAFATAWLVSRASGSVAGRVLRWHEQRHAGTDPGETGKLTEVKRHETLVALIRTGIAYAGFAAAAVLAFAELIGGVDRLAALAGASFMLILVGFAVQRVLTDIIAGFAMFAERWYAVGDTIAVSGLELQGVVEDVSLRRTKLRTLDGESIHIHNSQIPAVKVLPRGVKELGDRAVRLRRRPRRGADHVGGRAAARRARRRSCASRGSRRSSSFRRRSSASRFAPRRRPGREWLVDGFFSDLLREQAEPGLIVHGPIVLAVDETASRSFARASAAMRWQARREAA